MKEAGYPLSKPSLFDLIEIAHYGLLLTGIVLPRWALRRNISLSKLESRPSKESLGKYIFLVDLEGHREDPQITEALQQVCQKTALFKVFGSHTHDIKKKIRQIQQPCTQHCAPAPKLLAHPLHEFRDTLCCLLFWGSEESEQRLQLRGQFVAHVF